MSEISIIKGSNLPVMPTEDRVLDKLRLFGYRTDEMETVQIKGSEIQKELDKTVTDSSGYPEFDPEEDYFEGQVVSNQGKLYKFKNNHTAGPWDPSDVNPWSLGDEIAETNQEIADIKGKYAQKDGYYAQMTVGSAENLVGQTVDSEAYLIRPTGGEGNEVANGIASVVGFEGNSAVWNQLVNVTDIPTDTAVTNNGDGSITVNGTPSSDSVLFSRNLNLKAGRKYFITTNKPAGTARCVLTINNSTNITDLSDNGSRIVQMTQDTTSASDVFLYLNSSTSYNNITLYPYIIDLTLLSIDNLTTVAQVEAWLAQHVGAKTYYAYNAGEILNAKMIGMRTVGRNLLNPETKQATLIPYTWEDNSNVFIVKNVPIGATATFTPDNTGEAVSVDVSGGSLDITSYGSGVLELSAATADTYVCFKWDGTKDNDVVPHVEHSYSFDTRKVYGRANGQGEYVQCFPNGMGSAGSVRQSLKGSEAVVKIVSVNLGDLAWGISAVGTSHEEAFAGLSNGKYAIGDAIVANILCTRYLSDTAVHTWSHYADKTVCYYNGNVRVYDSSLIGKNEEQIKTAMNGVMLNYELATPITYTDLIYRDNGVDTPLSEVLINMEVDNWGIEQQLMTPYENGNPTSIPATLSTIYSMDAVEAIDTLQKTTYTEAEVHDNLAALLSCINTNSATVLGGTYAVSDTATDKVFEFTFTPNPEPEP